MIVAVQIGDRQRQLEVTPSDSGWRLRLDGEPLPADVALVRPGLISLLLDSRSYTFAWARDGQGVVWLSGGGREWQAEVRDPRQLLARRHAEPEGRARLTAPMAGKVVKLMAEPGSAIEPGQGIVVLEAMKMQNEVRSPKRGTLKSLAVAAGDTVATHQLLAEIE
jgi:acetyl/propionyl-CoA carboxylase alpha subunit